MQVDLARDAFTVSYDDGLVSAPQMLTTIEALGYDPRILESGLELSQISGVKTLPVPIQKLIDQQTSIAVYFGAPWCGACKIMERSTLTDQAVKDALLRYRYLKVDVEADAEIATTYAVSAVPTVIILNPQGEEVYRHVGPLSAAEFQLVLGEFN